MKTITYNKQIGVSVFEILAILIVLLIIIILFIPRVLDTHRPSVSHINVVKRDISLLQNAMDDYKKDNGFYPSTAQGLGALVFPAQISPIPRNFREGGYIQRIPLDPWGRNYYYLNPGKHNPNGIDIFTFGPSGKPAGVGNNSIIGNWNIHRTKFNG